MYETIRVGDLHVTYLKTRQETGNALELYEMTLPPATGAPVPHIHRDHDEIVLGMNGVITWTLGEEIIELYPGGRILVPRGTPHFFCNMGETTARMMVLQTPGVMGPEYFREISEHMGGDAPDMAAISAVMNRYGITPI